MYTVYIVDDEELIVNEIVELVPWMDNNFTVVGYSTDPLFALQDIKRLKPDVVFSDLKMPGLNGHELMAEIIEAGINSEFVMLSAYGTFDDARTFFKQEGFDYLLKPMQINEVSMVLVNLHKRLVVKKADRDLGGVSTGINTDDNISQIVNWVGENFTQKITLEDLSKKFGLSPNYICTRFSQAVNNSLTGYITRLRMEQASLYIKEGNLSMKEIAEKVGFNDYYYFNKVFKNYYDMTPTEFLKESRKV